MTIKTVVKMGSQQLSIPSLPVINFVDPMLKTIIADMRDTMLETKGVGIAAPQIHLKNELKSFIEWFHASRFDIKLDPLLRAGICHFWFVTLHLT